MLWGGWGNPFQAQYVERLYRGVQRHLSIPHRFVCFTDKPLELPYGIEQRVTTYPAWEGNLKKLLLYQPGLLKGRVLFFDLDTIIVGSLDEMASYDGEFCGIRAMAWPERKHTGGGMISFDDRIKPYLWSRIAGNARMMASQTVGRERIFYRLTLGEPDWWQALYPGQLVSYKKHCQEGVPEDARVVAFHGYPRPHEVHEEWVKRHWS